MTSILATIAQEEREISIVEYRPPTTRKPRRNAPWAWCLAFALMLAALASGCADGFDYQYDKAQRYGQEGQNR